MNLGKNFLGFLGRLLSAPCKFVGKSTLFGKKVIDQGLGGTMGGGKLGKISGMNVELQG